MAVNYLFQKRMTRVSRAEIIAKHAEDIAEKCWRQLNLSYPVDLEKICRFSEIELFYENLKLDCRGYYTQSKKGTHIIAINSNFSHHRRRYSLAHELGEYLVYNRGVFQEKQQKERFCNLYAANLLMPANVTFLQAMETNCDIKILSEMFDVSQMAVEIRLKELGLGN